MNPSMQKLVQLVRRHGFESVGGLLALVIVCVVVVLDFGGTNREVERLYLDSVAALSQFSELQFQVQETRRFVLYALTSTNSNVQLKSADDMHVLEKQVIEVITGQRKIFADLNQLTIWKRLQQDWTEYDAVLAEVLATVLEGDPEGAIALDTQKCTPLFERLRQDLSEIKKFHLDRANARLERVQSLFRRSIFKIIAIFAVYLVGASGAVFVLRRGTLAMRESEARFRGVVESLSEGILITDAEDRILLLNQRISELLGWRAEEMRGQKASELMIPAEPAGAAAARKARRWEGISEQYEIMLRRKDGRKIWVAVYSTPFRDAGGTITGVLEAFTDITEQKQAAQNLAQLNDQFAKSQRKAGMAEVATSVLHNVGNVLNSVNVSASILRDSLSKSQIGNLAKATALLREHTEDAATYLASDPKGKLLPGFLIKLSDNLVAQQQAWQVELDGLNKNVEHIKEIVAMQQSYARLSGVTEALPAEVLVEDALRMNDVALGRHGVRVVREYAPVPLISVDKHKVLQILVNLIRNAKHAMDDSPISQKTLTLAIQLGESGLVNIIVRDTGTGIPAENLTRIFQHGFTTKKEGHGFGLHSGANAAKEMGGRLTARSEGAGRGAEFTLELPIASPQGDAITGPPARSTS